jgi:low temperature requirement protein LtrA
LVHGHRGVERHASWLELFFDLLFVALFSQLALELVHDLRPAIVLGALGLFAPAWWAWVSYTVSTNLFGETGPGHRILILAMMGCLLVMISGVRDAFGGDPVLYATGFAASRAVLLVLVAVWQWRTPEHAVPAASYVCYSTTFVLFVVSIAVDPPLTYGLWAVALLIEIATRFREQSAHHRDPDMPPVNVELLVERFGLIVMVALGEGVAGIGLAISETEGSVRGLVTGIAAFFALAALWWWYFDFASTTIPAGYRDHPRTTIGVARDVHVLGHFVLVGAVVAVSAALRPVIEAAAASTTASNALAFACDGLVVAVLALSAMARRLGVPWRRAIVGVVPASLLGILALTASSWSPIAAVVAIVVILAGTAAVERAVAVPQT